MNGVDLRPGRAARLAATMVPALMLLAGCLHAPAPDPADAPVPPGQRKPGAPTIMLIEQPKNVREDVLYPKSVMSGFSWSRENTAWRIKLPSGRYGHAGFRFTLPHNLDAARDRYELILLITPADMARHLWIGLVDGKDHPERVLVDLPLSRYAGRTKGRDPMEIRIPLRDFPSRGQVLAAEDEDEGDPGKDHEAAFDWGDVQEIRLIHNGGRLPNREVTITELRFQR